MCVTFICETIQNYMKMSCIKVEKFIALQDHWENECLNQKCLNLFQATVQIKNQNLHSEIYTQNGGSSVT